MVRQLFISHYQLVCKFKAIADHQISQKLPFNIANFKTFTNSMHNLKSILAYESWSKMHIWSTYTHSIQYRHAACTECYFAKVRMTNFNNTLDEQRLPLTHHVPEMTRRTYRFMLSCSDIQMKATAKCAYNMLQIHHTQVLTTQISPKC